MYYQFKMLKKKNVFEIINKCIFIEIFNVQDYIFLLVGLKNDGFSDVIVFILMVLVCFV